VSSAQGKSIPFGLWLLRRLLSGALTLLIVMTLTFFLLRLLPGSPFDSDKGLSPLVKQALEARFHLDEPLWMQYGLYIKGVLVGDLGPSLTQEGRLVSDMLMEAVGVSFGLGALALVIGTPLGVLAALIGNETKKQSLQEGLDSLVSILLASPSFLIAGLLIIVFSVTLGWLPPATLTTPAHWILPSITLAVLPFTFSYLLLKQSLKDESSALYLTMKHAAGIPKRQVLVQHLLRNAWLPLLSLAGPLVANLMTGSFAVEFLYAIPGMGRQFIAAIINRDYTVVLGETLVYALLLLVMNLVADIITAKVDPRMRAR